MLRAALTSRRCCASQASHVHARRRICVGYRIVEGDGSPHFVQDPATKGQIIDPRVFQDRDQALSHVVDGQKLRATTYSLRTQERAPEGDAYRFAEPGLRELAGTGRFDPAQVAVLVGSAPPITGSLPAEPSDVERAFLSRAAAAHDALCYSDPGRSLAVERDWRRAVDRLEAHASTAEAPEDVRAFAAAIRAEQDGQLPGYELARFVSRAHTAVGLPVSEIPLPTEEDRHPLPRAAFTPETIERLGECNPVLHAAERELDPRSPLAHPAPTDHPGQGAAVADALDAVRRDTIAVHSMRLPGDEAVSVPSEAQAVDPVDAAAAVAVVQQAMLSDPPPLASGQPLVLSRPVEGRGSPSFEDRLSASVSALVAAFDDSGVSVVFEKLPAVGGEAARPFVRVTEPPPPAGGGVDFRSERPGPTTELVLPAEYAANRSAPAEAVRDGLPSVRGDLDTAQLEALFDAAATAVPAAFGSAPYSPELATARQAVYKAAGNDEEKGALFLREAAHFAARLTAAVEETVVRPPSADWQPPPALAAQAQAVDALCMEMAAAGAASVRAVAADLAADGQRAVARREESIEVLEETLVPALRDAGLNVEVRRAASQYRPADPAAPDAGDAVVLSKAAFEPSGSTASLARQHARALSAVALASGQPGRAERPDAVAVAAELAGGRAAPAAARQREQQVSAHFARERVQELWPRHAPVPPKPRERDGKSAANTASRWVQQAVETRAESLEEAARPPARDATELPVRPSVPNVQSHTAPAVTFDH